MAILTIGAVPASHADEVEPSGTGGGGPVDPDWVQSAAERERAEAKAALAEAYVAAKSGSGTAAELQSAAQDYEALGMLEESHLEAVEELVTLGSDAAESLESAPGHSARAVAAAASVTNILNLTQYPQSTDWYCGPATGRMIMKYKNRNTSAVGNLPPTQATFAKPRYMNTAANEITTFSSGRLRIGLNYYWGGANSGWWATLAQPTAAQFKNTLIANADMDYPTAVSTVEYANGLRYNGHPFSTSNNIGHWIVAHGYGDSGERTRFADPATSVWTAVQPHFGEDTDLFRSRFVISNGIVA